MTDHSALLGIYLNDHLAGATAGLELFRRATGSATGDLKIELGQITDQVQQDRAALLAMMQALDLPVRHYKVLGGWALEKVGRLKSNGHLLSRSPLSDLVELEGLVLAVAGKAAGFRALHTLAGSEPRLDRAELLRLVERAEQQGAVLERLRLAAVQRIFAGRSPAASAATS